MIYSKINGDKSVSLSDHTKMVINLAVETAKNKIKNPDNAILSKIAIAAALHDIGKCSNDFQNYIINKNTMDDEDMETFNKKKNNPTAYHNTVSWAFARCFINELRSKTPKYQPIRSAILYHHTVKDDISTTASSIIGNMMENDPSAIESMKEFYLEMLAYIDEMFSLNLSTNEDFALKKVDSTDDLSLAKIEEESLYEYDENVFASWAKDKIGFRSKYQDKAWETAIVRACVVYADRTVSSMKYDNEKIKNLDIEYIHDVFDKHIECNYSKQYNLDEYDKVRLQSQIDIVNTIKNGDNGVYDISASAGFGKTLIGLIHHFENRKKTMWVVPRTIIADGTYNSIISEVEKMGMGKEVKVGLMYGNELKKCNFNESENISISHVSECDILVVVIDSFLSRYSKNNLSTLLIDSYFGDVIFDEYHEFICREPLFAAFLNMAYARNMKTNTKTILMSASGFPEVMENIIGKVNQINPSIFGGDTKVKVNVHRIDSIDDMELDSDENSFTIMPVVESAQNMKIRNSDTDTILIHSRYTENDREEKEKLVYDFYGKHTTKKEKVRVIGTSIIGTGLDISAKSISHYMPTPESSVQICCGRSSRFNEYDSVTYNVYVCSDHRKFLNGLYNPELRSKWVDVLTSIDGTTITKSELYSIRKEFNKKHVKKLTEYIMSCYKSSAEYLSNIVYRGGCAVIDKGYNKITKSYTYRGASDSFYATVKVGDGYAEPIICDSSTLNYERDNEGNGDSKVRFDFMLSNDKTGFNFPTESELKYVYSIRKHSEATVEKCASVANRSDRPLLFNCYGYTKDLGLYRS